MSQHTVANHLGGFVGRLRRLSAIFWRCEARFKGVEFQGPVDLVGRPILSLARGGKIILGSGVRLNSSLRANPLACFQPCVLRALASGSRIVLGSRVGMSATVLCAGASIEVGEGTIFGAGAMVLDNDFHSPVGEFDWSGLDVTGARPIRIGRGVFIGARAIILKGVTIGDRAVIGAGAVVVKDVPAEAVAVGNPARVVNRKAEI